MRKSSKPQSQIYFRDPVFQQGFTQIANTVLDDSSLSHVAFRTYLHLVKFAWHKGNCFPGHNKLAKLMSVSRSTVMRALKELKKRGLISWKQRGMTKTNIYYIEPLQNVYKMSDVSPVELQEVSPMTHQEVPPMEHKEYNVNNTKIKNTKLTLDDENKFSSYSEEAVSLAKEFDDFKSINYFQKIVSQKDKGEINPDDFYSALTFIRDQMNIQEKDGISTIKNPASLFVKRLKKLIEKRKQSEKQEIYQKQLSKLSEEMRL
jgi:predicted transcriptional regulator